MKINDKMWLWGRSQPYTEIETPFVDGYTEYTPTFNGFSVQPQVEARYYSPVSGMVHLWMTTTVHGTSISTSFSFNLPVVASSTISQNCVVASSTNNNNTESLAGRVVITQGSTTATCYINSALGAWTAIRNKSINLNIIYESSGYTSYTPIFGGYLVSPTVVARYNNSIPNFTHLWITTTTHGTSNSTIASGLTITLPVTSTNTITQYLPVTSITDNGISQQAQGLMVIPPNSNTATIYRNGTLATAWTGSGNKSFNLSVQYQSAT